MIHTRHERIRRFASDCNFDYTGYHRTTGNDLLYLVQRPDNLRVQLWGSVAIDGGFYNFYARQESPRLMPINIYVYPQVTQ